MSNDRTQILKMLKEGKISVSEADELLDALGKPQREADSAESERHADADEHGRHKKKPKYLHVHVDSKSNENGKKEKVTIKVPLQLLRAGVKLANVIPDEAKGKVDNALKEKGISLSFDELTGDNLDELIHSLSDLTVDVDSDDEKVSIFCG
jgi:hypothetical protein